MKIDTAQQSQDIQPGEERDIPIWNPTDLSACYYKDPCDKCRRPRDTPGAGPCPLPGLHADKYWE
jgi:hypothetical protein